MDPVGFLAVPVPRYGSDTDSISFLFPVFSKIVYRLGRCFSKDPVGDILWAYLAGIKKVEVSMFVTFGDCTKKTALVYNKNIKIDPFSDHHCGLSLGDARVDQVHPGVTNDGFYRLED